MASPSASPSAEGGWVLPGLGLLLAGSGWAWGLAWARLGASTAPSVPAFAAVSVGVGLVAFSLAARVALDPARAPEWWRPFVAALVLAGAAALVATSRARLAWSVLPALAAMALIARAAETVGGHLASQVRLPEEYAQGDWSQQVPETRRIVLEMCLLAAGAATVARPGAGLTAALAAVGLGGLTLAAGSHIHALRRLSAAEGIAWEARDLALAWRWTLAIAGGAVGLAALVPGVPALIPQGIPYLVHAVYTWLFLPRPAGAGPHRAPPPQALPGRGAFGLPLPNVGGGTPVSVRLFGLGGVGWVAVLLGAVLLVVVVVAYVRFAAEVGGGFAGTWRRLWEGLLAVLAFWRWLFAGRGGRGPEVGAGRASGARSPAAGGRPAPEPPLGLFGDPRRLIRASYRRFLRRAAEAGYPRGVGETPARYEGAIGAVLADARPEAAALTRAYEEARYSVHTLTRERAARAREAMERLTARLHPGLGSAARGARRRPHGS